MNDWFNNCERKSVKKTESSLFRTTRFLHILLVYFVRLFTSPALPHQSIV